jgi:hypothetical protein
MVRGYDQNLSLVAQKRLINQLEREIAQIADLADKLRWLIPEGEYDFEAAKARVLASYPRR